MLNATNAGERADKIEATPLRRLGKPIEVADGVLFLGACDWAKQQVRALVDGPCDSSRRHYQRLLAECLGPYGEEPIRD
jgi:hypothetical protein